MHTDRAMFWLAQQPNRAGGRTQHCWTAQASEGAYWVGHWSRTDLLILLLLCASLTVERGTCCNSVVMLVGWLLVVVYLRELLLNVHPSL